ncbi:hypothetical protein [Mycobacterium terramassiliense]|uniref:Scaffolding protein n=1 Tax=Mycobacterium terramassiliense TaxID=1841859 RepID=A0A2U3NJH2_9MYCO|nr:hypothetical protein [Mycobacterium terramassiliense]SPM31575.1 hypothetical protein P863_04320 [Mycobacterium terramassiliense]
MSDEARPDAAEDVTIPTRAAETVAADATTAETTPDAPESDTAPNDEPAEGADTFDRAYVEKLRKESAGYRDRAKTAEDRADSLSKRLFYARVAATGRLSDPSDLEYDEAAVTDDNALNAAIDTLLELKPHYKSRVPRGEVGQGLKDSAPAQVDLLGRIRSLV